MRELRSFQQGDEELRGSTVIEYSFCGSRYCGLATITAATERLLKALRVNDVEILSVEDLWASSTDLWGLLTTV